MKKQGLLQAVSVVGYIGIIVAILSNGKNFFGQLNEVTGPLLMLSLLSVSVLTCALLVLARPFRLFLDKKGEQALQLVIDTAFWLAIFVVFTLIVIFLTR